MRQYDNTCRSFQSEYPGSVRDKVDALNIAMRCISGLGIVNTVLVLKSGTN